MTSEWSQPELVAANGRRFAGFAAAVLVFIIDPSTRRFLLLSSPAKRELERHLQRALPFGCRGIF